MCTRTVGCGGPGPHHRTRVLKALGGALRRVGQVAEIGLGTVDLSEVPPRRVVDPARVGMRANTTHLRRLRPRVKQVATLATATVELEARATDDALELFDLIMTSELLAKSDRQWARMISERRSGWMHRKAEEESALALGADRRQRRGAPPGRREPGPPIAGRSKADRATAAEQVKWKATTPHRRNIEACSGVSLQNIKGV
jgi:hypothetical protein